MNPDVIDLTWAAYFGTWNAPWDVRAYPWPQAAPEHPWLWFCGVCPASGRGINEADAHCEAARHYLTDHAPTDPAPAAAAPLPATGRLYPMPRPRLPSDPARIRVDAEPGPSVAHAPGAGCHVRAAHLRPATHREKP